MPKTQRKPKKSERPATNKQRPERADIEAELPHPPAKEPLAEPPPIGGTSGPRARIEPEPE